MEQHDLENKKGVRGKKAITDKQVIIHEQYIELKDLINSVVLDLYAAIEASGPGGGGETNTASNVGTGEGEVFKQKVVADLELKTIKAGENITIINNASDITIIAAGAAVVLLEAFGSRHWNPTVNLQNLSEFISGIVF